MKSVYSKLIPISENMFDEVTSVVTYPVAASVSRDQTLTTVFNDIENNVKAQLRATRRKKVG